MDSGAVDSAVLGLLANDATLKGLCPDGVYFSMAPQGAKKFVVVSLTDHDDVPMFAGGKAFEIFDYLVKAVHFDTSASNARKAATQIDALLTDAFVLTPPGYKLVRSHRTAYRRYSEPDVNPDQRWQHDGGEYEIVVAPTNP